jgi:hypothetical protein
VLAGIAEKKAVTLHLPLEPDIQPIEEDWADQLQAEYEKLSAQRASMIEGLLIARDYQGCIDLVTEWKAEDDEL